MTRLRRLLILLAAFGLATLAACERQAEGEGAGVSQVDASRYDAFWLWAGVKPQPVLDKAKTVYILDSEIRASDTDTGALTPLRPAIPRITHADIWFVVRVETLNWSDDTYAVVLQRLGRWAASNRLAGLQIDFDARTQGLNEYAGFLRDLRQRLPKRYKLSITGLLDWSANGDPEGLAALAGSVDEIVLQTYQGRKTIPGYQRYLAKLDRLDTPFRIGLVQGGEWHEPQSLRAHPAFRGYVIFLLNQDKPVHRR